MAIIGATGMLGHHTAEAPVKVRHERAVVRGQFLSGAKAEQERGFKAGVSLDERVARALRGFGQAGYVHS